MAQRNVNVCSILQYPRDTVNKFYEIAHESPHLMPPPDNVEDFSSWARNREKVLDQYIAKSFNPIMYKLL